MRGQARAAAAAPSAASRRCHASTGTDPGAFKRSSQRAEWVTTSLVIYEEALMTAHLTMEQRQLARRLHARGLSLREIGRQVGCSHEVVRTVVRRDSKRPVRSQPWQPGPGRLTLADREEISLGMRAGASFTAIAASLGKAVSTISRQVARNGGRT